MPIEPVAMGFYGKIPARGDFVRKGLPHDFVQAWDGWMAGVMASSQAMLGNGWNDAFMTAPLWRFHLAGGVCGAAPASGVMAPSVDRVGRAFPLVLCRLGAVPLGSLLSTEGAAWYRSCETVALAALEEHLQPEALFAHLVEQTAMPQTAGTDDTGGCQEGRGPQGLRSPLSKDDEPLREVPAISLLRLGLAEINGVSLWWTEGSDLVEPSTLLCRGMPGLAKFPAMLNGDWAGYGWNLNEKGGRDDSRD